MSKQSDLVTVARDAGASGYVNVTGDTMTGALTINGDLSLTSNKVSAGEYRLGSLPTAPIIGTKHQKWSNPDSTNVSSNTNWINAFNGANTYTKQLTSSLLRVRGWINTGHAFTDPSGINHGYVDVRFAVSASGRTTQYSGTGRNWARVDNFSGVFEITHQSVIEWISDSVFQAGDTVTVQVQYMNYNSGGSGKSGGGVNMWGGGSYFQIDELDWGN